VTCFSNSTADKGSVIDAIRDSVKSADENIELNVTAGSKLSVTFADGDLAQDGDGLTLYNIAADGKEKNSPAKVTISGNKAIVKMTGEPSGSPLITVGNGVTLTLRDITFEGLPNNIAPLIEVKKGGTLIMDKNGAVITGNKNDVSGGGVSVSYGELIMYGGEISGNEAARGAGVFVGREGKFLMYGEKIKISGNEAAHGAGVFVEEGIFRMYKGDIIKNKATESGGGVHVASGGKFELGGGNIKGNSSSNGQGGGVAIVEGGFFFMQNGSISSNYIENTENNVGTGPGVYLYKSTAFVKTGGTIYGWFKGDGEDSDPGVGEDSALRNYYEDEAVTEYKEGGGYALYYKYDDSQEWRYCDKTLGQEDTLLDTGTWDGWMDGETSAPDPDDEVTIGNDE
jgi:hypothetical protein